MNKTTNLLFGLALLLLSTLIAPLSAYGQGTAFTYQGFLTANGAPANASNDFTFALFNAVSGGAQSGATLQTNGVGVTNGLFTVALDFGSAPFNGSALWLQIATRPAGSSTFTNVTPRQPIASTPYAVYAGGANAAGLTGTLPLAQLPGAVVTNGASGVNLTGAFTGNGAGVTNFSTTNLVGSLGSAQLAGIYANAVTFSNASGTFRGNGAGLTNLGASNLVGVVGSAQLAGIYGSPVIFSNASGAFSGNGAGLTNLTASNLVGVVGGTQLAGTYGNPVTFSNASGTFSGNGAGLANLAASNLVGVLGVNQLAGAYGNAVVFNNALNTFAGNGGGLTNLNAATLGGLTSAAFWKTNGNAGANPTNGAFLGTSDNLPLEFKVNGQRAWRLEPTADGAPNVIGGASVNFVVPGVIGATIAGGGAANYSGYSLTNSVSADLSTIGGGGENQIQTNADFSTIGGGGYNQIQIGAQNSTIGGGGGNRILDYANASTIGGGFGNLIQASTTHSTIGGGSVNQIQTAIYSTIGGGRQNQIQTNAQLSTIGGGYNNRIQINAYASTIGGGYLNNIQPDTTYSAIGGGYGNQLLPNADYSTIPGGYLNSATNYAFAAGNRAKAVTTGAFVWADSQTADFTSTATNQFLIRAQGGVGINMNNPGGAGLYVQGSRTGGFAQSIGFFENTNSIGSSAPALRVVAAGGNAGDGALSVSANGTGLIARFGNFFNWVVDISTNGNVTANGVLLTSDRNAKENFTPLDAQAVLAKVAALPITEWNYKNDTTTRHVGPMAQDFKAAFDVGSDDKHISVVDESGVALAAIQGLNQKLEATRAENAELKRELAEIKRLLQKH